MRDTPASFAYIRERKRERNAESKKRKEQKRINMLLFQGIQLWVQVEEGEDRIYISLYSVAIDGPPIQNFWCSPAMKLQDGPKHFLHPLPLPLVSLPLPLRTHRLVVLLYTHSTHILYTEC